MLKMKAVLFDLDGTLLDTAPDLAAALNQLLQENSRPHLPYDIIREVVSDGAKAMLELAFDISDSDQQYPALRQRLLEIYEENIAVYTQLFTGLDVLLEKLEKNNIHWGIVTNKPRYLSVKLLEALELLERCATLVCADDVANRKPHPEPLLKACQEINCLPTETIYIGDHLRDIQAGKNAGMKTISALFGYIHKDEDPLLWNADISVQKSTELEFHILP